MIIDNSARNVTNQRVWGQNFVIMFHSAEVSSSLCHTLYWVYLCWIQCLVEILSISYHTMCWLLTEKSLKPFFCSKTTGMTFNIDTKRWYVQKNSTSQEVQSSEHNKSGKTPTYN